MKKGAVALKYNKEEDNAPIIIAKGKGAIADRILEIAKEYNIPLYKDEKFFSILEKFDNGVELPEILYPVLAEIFAFVYSLDKKANSL